MNRISRKIVTIIISLLISITAFSKITLVYSSNATQGDAHYEAMMKFKELVEEKSKGDIIIKTYGAGSLLKQAQELPGLKMGQADIVQLGASWLSENSPWVSMFSAGYIFKDYDEMNIILNGEIGEEVFDRISKEQGVIPLSAWYLGTRQVNLVKDKEIRTPADLKGVNLRMPNSEAWLFLGRAIGANPTPIAFSELYLALQSGTVDGQENPLPTVKSAKFYEVTKSISITNHLVDSVWPSMSVAKWNSLKPEQQKIIKESMIEAGEYCANLNLEREKELVEFFKEKGLKVYNADLDIFSKEVLEKYLSDEKLSKQWDMDLYRRVQEAKK